MSGMKLGGGRRKSSLTVREDLWRPRRSDDRSGGSSGDRGRSRGSTPNMREPRAAATRRQGTPLPRPLVDGGGARGRFEPISGRQRTANG